MSAFRLGSFEILHKAASGGMGDIWRGVHAVQDVPVAIKVLRQSGMRQHDFALVFRREVQAVAQLDHPGIITLFDIGEVSDATAAASGGALDAHSPYLVMEYLERGSLESLTYPLPWARTREILMAVLDGLAHAHARGITHRDLKPANILLADPSTGSPIRLTDFGIAFPYREGRSTEAEGTVSGTPTYMAPEQFMGAWRDFGPRTDLYALGCIAFELASGRIPFRQLDLVHLGMAHLEEPPPALQCPPDYPADFAAWVMRLLEKAPADRYRCCADAAGALTQLVPSASAPSRSPVVSWVLPASPATAGAGDWRAPARPPQSFKLVGAGLRLFGLRTVPLVDRTAECDVLWTTFGRVVERSRPGLVVLEGPAGVGKSRLAAWLCQRTHELGLAEHLSARHDRSGGGVSALSHMVAAAWSCLGIGAADLPDRVTTLLASVGIDEPAAQNAVAELLAPAALGSDFSPGQFHEFPSSSARFRVLLEVLQHLAAQRPLVVWLDDVHWSSETLQFIRYVLERAQAEPAGLLAVVTVRDDLIAASAEAAALLRDLCRDEASVCVHVEPLREADSRRLVGSLLHLEGGVAERVATRSGGNPLYATQLVGDWVERGVLEPGTSGFVLAGGEVPDIPDDVHALWLRRLDRVLDESLATLPRTARTDAERMQRQVLLELAAALGGSVDMVEWVALCSRIGIADPTPVLQLLVATRLAQLGDDSWAFSHGMLRDSLERIARERGRWASHNRLCADMLEHRRPVPHWGESERIGRHRFAAAQYDAATRSLLRGARERVRLDEYAAALGLLALYDRALDELGRSSGDPQRIEGWLLQADIHSMRQELDAAEALARRVQTLAEGAEFERFGGAALLVSARVHEQQGRSHTALEEYRRAQEALRVTGPPSVLAACLSEQAHVLLELGQLDESWETYHDAQAIYEDTGQMVPWSENQLGLARVAVRQGDVSHAMALCRRVQTFGRRERLGRVEAAACAALAEAQTAAGRLPDAIDSLDRGIQLFEELGLDRRALRSSALKVLLLLESGTEDRAASALALLRTSLIVDAPVRARLLVSGVSLTMAVGDSDADFAAHVNRTAALLAEMEALDPEAARSLRMALARARQRGLADRVARIEQLLSATALRPRDAASDTSTS